MTGDGNSKGHDSRYCGSRKKQGEGTCTRPAGWGTNHPGWGCCKLHGGCTQTVAEGAAREQIKAAVVTYGLPVDIDPTEALLQEVRHTAGHVAWLRQRIAELEQEALIWNRAEEVEKTATEFPGIDVTSKAAPHVWIDLYHRERKHLIDVCKAAIAAGIEERRVRIAEAQGNLLADVIRGILSDLQLTPEQQARVPEVVPARLREMSTSAA